MDEVAFNPRFERIWLESKKRLPDYIKQKPANTRLRSKYARRLYSWAKKHVKAGTMSVSLENLHGQSSQDLVSHAAVHNRPDLLFGIKVIWESGIDLARLVERFYLFR